FRVYGGKNKRFPSDVLFRQRSAPPSHPASPINWSADGKLLLFTRQEHPEYGDNDLTTLQVLDADSSEIRRVTTRKTLESFGLFSPDGSRIAYWYPHDGDPNNQTEIFVTQASGGDGTS